MTVRGSLAIPPLPPESVIYSATTTHPRNTPWMSWSEGTDLSKTGLNSYEISLGSTPCGTEFFNWTNTNILNGDSLNKRYGSFYSTTAGVSFTEGIDYYFNVRSKDNFNQVGEPTCKKFNYTTTGWKQQSYFKAANSDGQDQFSTNIAIDGDTMVISASKESSSQTTITNGATASSDNSAAAAGAVYVYRRIAGAWHQEAYIKAVNADAGDQFGYRVAISGDTLAVSAIFEASSQTTITNGTTASSNNSRAQAGAVYVYKRTGTTWAQEAYIKASNANTGDLFGAAIGLSGNTLAVGANGQDSLQNNSGAVYIYTRSGVSWTQQTMIKAANADPQDQLGIVLALDGDTLAVTGYSESSAQTTITNGTSAAGDNGAPNSGAVYVYKRSGVTWNQEAYIKASNAHQNDYFGYSLSLSGDTLAVGSFLESSNAKTITNGQTSSSDRSATQSGAVYVYKRTVNAWAQEAYIKAANNRELNSFGYAVSLNGDKLAVGAPNEGSNVNTVINDTTIFEDTNSLYSGAVYIYQRSGSTWSSKAYIKALNSYSGLNLGTVVFMDSSSLAVGSKTESTSGTAIINEQSANTNIETGSANSGAVYLYTP